MKKVITVYKPVGLSPLQTIYTLKQKYPEYRDEKISYAGRLDPMAEGLLLLLLGDENKNRNQYENLPKTYEFSVLLGMATDTYDILGKILHIPCSIFHLNEQINQYLNNKSMDNGKWKMINNILSSLKGTHIQPYPPYSSRTVQGKPLYWWARHEKLDEIDIPKKKIEIFDLQLLSGKKITKKKLQKLVYEKISKAQGDFRQDEILQLWKKFFNAGISCMPDQTFYTILNCKVGCSSGTYVRSIANEIGNKLGTGGIALFIKRTNIGKYSVKDAIYL